jgi:ADP-ribosylglycohydrolase
MPIPTDYEERVYAGVLGKVIGVYLGRPFEGWSYDAITKRLGDVYYYQHERLGVPLIVTDDDISGTFTFVRALEDYGYSRDITSEQIGRTWLNYLIENRTILWWGGLGVSSEHTAYLRLKTGVKPPLSGSVEMNGKVTAQQVGAQIFIDGWGMVCPGDPAMAADFARRAASVSHDGEAIYGAQVIAAMEAAAFGEPDINSLIDTAIQFIPRDSVIFRMIADIREWAVQTGDWRKTRELLEKNYGYDKYGGGCHIIPNHGLIILSLLHGEGSFQKTLMIVNTCGWDTDCNSANAGCIMGIRNGLRGIDASVDFRTPVADRLYLPTADGGRAISDALTEAYHLINSGRILNGLDPVSPKNGARFHFTLPGSVQGFHCDEDAESRDTVSVENVEGHSKTGARSLALRYHHIGPGRTARVLTPTFIPPGNLHMGGYSLMASPTLYPGQTVYADVTADETCDSPATCRLYLRRYDDQDSLVRIPGPDVLLKPGHSHNLIWRIPDMMGYPIAEIGIEIASDNGANGTIYLDYLTWQGEPDCALGNAGGDASARAWVNGADHYECGEHIRITQNSRAGLLIQGTRHWRDYSLHAVVTPHLVESAGIAVRVQGMKRYYAFLLTKRNRAALIRELDGTTILSEIDYVWDYDCEYELHLSAHGTKLIASINGNILCEAEDNTLTCGAIALVTAEGRCQFDGVCIKPL